MTDAVTDTRCKTKCLIVAALAGGVTCALALLITTFIIAFLMGLAVAALFWALLSLSCDKNHYLPLKTAGVPGAASARSGGAAENAGAPAAKAPVAKADKATDVSTDEATATPDYDGDGLHEGTGEGKRPAALKAARGGKADDLKQIKGVGPKMQTMLNEMGFYHFDQVARWGDDEVAWVDANLKGFKGRVSRDNWVEQAKTLAAGGETEFSKRVEDGGVY